MEAAPHSLPDERVPAISYTVHHVGVSKSGCLGPVLDTLELFAPLFATFFRARSGRTGGGIWLSLAGALPGGVLLGKNDLLVEPGIMHAFLATASMHVSWIQVNSTQNV